MTKTKAIRKLSENYLLDTYFYEPSPSRMYVITYNSSKMAMSLFIVCNPRHSSSSWIMLVSPWFISNPGGGGGGYLTKFNTWRLRPEVQPLTLLYTILAKRYPFYIPSIEKRCPFHTPTLRSLVLIFMWRLIYKLVQLKGASIKNIIIKGPSEYLNNRFSYPFIYLSL